MNGRENPPADQGPLLAQGFSAHLRRWAERAGARRADIEVLCEAGDALILALARGEVCVPIDPTHATALRASGCVALEGPPQTGGPCPLVLDPENRLYLARYHDFETRLAHEVRTLVAAVPSPPGPRARTWLQSLYPAASASASPDRQALATAFALTRRLTVISGGPGTGKTTTVLRVLICLLAEQPELRIALAAPTGKAAARLAESVAQGLAALPDLDPALCAAIPREASTLHRLLGLGYRKTSRPGCLLHDVVVVDEASMLDLALAARLFGALGPSARIILLGDKDQLAAVEPGAVFSELAAGQGLSDARAGQLADLLQCSISHIRDALPPARGGELQDCAIWLTRTYRFAEGSAIAALADAVRARKVEAVDALLASANAEAGEMIFVPHEGDSLARRIFDQLTDGFAAFRDALSEAKTTDEQSLRQLFTAFGHFRVLCALREGPRGVETLNREISARLDAVSARRRGRTGEWFKGRPVLIAQNDHALGLFNGDVGIALPTESELRESHPWDVVFEDPKGGFRRIPAVRLPAHETAFAMTVHKSQGTEFDRVAVVLPAARTRVLTRELVYTAITRARKQVLLVGSADRITEALSKTTHRESGLARRLARAAEKSE